MKLRLILAAHFLVFLLVNFPVSVSYGQKNAGDDSDQVGIFQSRAQYNEFMGSVKRSAYGENGSPELQAMVPMLNDMALNRPVGSTAAEYGLTGSTMGLLTSDEVRAEIELVDDQYEQLQTLGQEIQKRSANQLRELDFSDSSKLVERIREIRDSANMELESVLLPHQLARLQQVRMQSLLRRQSLIDVLTSDPIKSDLEITEKQSAELRKEAELIEADLKREIAKLRQRAQDRLLSKLQPNQAAEIKDRIGNTFKFKAPESLKKKNIGRLKSEAKK